MNLERIQITAAEIAREAGALLRRAVHEVKEIETKSSAIDLVTQYDAESEEMIIGRLRAAFPEHNHFAEEGDYAAVSRDELTWYIDPIDGTNNFAHGLPCFVVSLALYHGMEPLVAVIYEPMRDELFQATAGGGALLVTGGLEQRKIQVSETAELVGSLLASGFPYDRHSSDEDNLAQFGAFLKRVQGLRRMGSAALDLAYVAAGRLDGYWEYKLNSWDVAAGVLLVQEAGGLVSTMDGAPFQLTPRVDLIASNGQIHGAMVAVLEGAG